MHFQSKSFQAGRLLISLATFALTMYATAVVAQDEEEEPLSVLDLVEECDILAAHGLDPQRMSEGVEDERIVPGLAIPACEDALTRNPDDPRLTFQLGRAFLAVDRDTDALTLFNKAAEAGYAAAYAYLGDAYQFGLGTTADAEKALAAYRAAVEKGFPAAPQLNMMSFDANMYAVPVVGALYSGAYDPAQQADGEQGYMLRNYVFSFVSAVNDECGAVLDSKIMARLFGFRYPAAGYDAEVDARISVAVMGSTADYDARRFLQRHGCDGIVADQMIGQINTAFKGPAN